MKKRLIVREKKYLVFSEKYKNYYLMVYDMPKDRYWGFAVPIEAFVLLKTKEKITNKDLDKPLVEVNQSKTMEETIQELKNGIDEIIK